MADEEDTKRPTSVDKTLNPNTINDDLETWYAPLGTQALPSFYKW